MSVEEEGDCCKEVLKDFYAQSSPGISYVSATVGSYFDRDNLVYKGGSNGDYGDFVIDRIRAEREMDVFHLSYPIATFLDYFDKYLAWSIDMCKQVRTDLKFRTRFQTDDDSIEP